VKWLAALVAAFLCACAPTPELCRDWGVDVQDDDIVTGKIVEYHLADFATVQARCQCPFEPHYGCAIPVQPGQWVIWAIDDTGVRAHQECHVLFEEKRHTE
jgi:hypothetical protein